MPLYNEEAVLPMLHRRLLAALADVTCGIEIIYFDDGSTDRTDQMLQQLRLGYACISVISAATLAKSRR